MKTAGQFTQRLASEFPELREEIQEDEGLLHLQMHAFTRITQEAISIGDFEKLRKQFALAHEFFSNAEPNLENAFYVSYLEDLEFDGANGEKAKKMLSPVLLQGWKDIMYYMDELAKLSRKERSKD